MRRPVRWSSDALSDLADQIAWLAADNPAAARRVAAALDQAGLALGEMPTGRPGRVTGTYEKLVTGLPYILAYVIVGTGEQEEVAIVRVIHTSRDWPAEGWPS